MHKPGLRLYWRRAGAIIAGLAMVGVLLGPAPAASATGTITQAAPLQGVTLLRTAFTDQLQVSGATGAVTFAQSTGSGNISVSSLGAVSAPSTLAVGVYSATGTDSDPSGDSGTWAYTLNVLAPAPQGFSTTVVDVYKSEYAVAQQLGRSSSLQPISQYGQAVSQSNALQLAALYDAVQQNPEWYQIPSLMQTVASDAALTQTSSTLSQAGLMRVAGTASLKAGSLRPGSPGPGHTSGTKARPRPGAYGSVMKVRAQGQQTPVGPFVPQSCPPGIPDAAVFALQIVVDVSQSVYNVLMALTVAFADAIDTQVGLGIAASVAAGVLAAAVIVHDVLAFEAQLASDCASNNLAGQVANIDNTTVQTYSLLTTLGTAVTELQTTENTTLTDVENVQTMLTDLKNTFLQTMATDTQTVQTTVGSDTQAVYTNLQTEISSLQSDVTTIESDQTALSNKVINQVNTDSSSVQSSLSSALTKILSQTDSSAESLAILIGQDNQQVLNALQSNFTTQQSEYYANLTLEIENALAQYGPTVAEVQLVLPASQGGYLNSTPVGVQEVVTNDLNAFAALGGKVTPDADKYLNEANAALAAGDYITAYEDYADCYQTFA